MTGYTREELLGKSMRLLRGPETDLSGLQQSGKRSRPGETVK